MSASIMRVALPLAGAAVGSFIPGLGTMAGLSLGEVAAGFLFPIPGPKPDLKIQGYTYGAAIPRVYGKNRMAGTVIWASNKVAHGKGPVGSSGGGGGSSPTNTYTISFAAMICVGPINAITRIWADGQLIYDGRPGAAHPWSAGVNGSNVRFYLGTATQTADPSIQTAQGTVTPAYRYRAYVVFQDYDLTNSGNQIPNMEFEVSSSATAVTLDAVVMDICQQASRTALDPNTYSLATTDFNLSAISGITISGYCIPTRVPAKDAITELQNAYHFDLVEIDGLIQAVLRSTYSPIAITDTDMGARDAGHSGAGAVDAVREEVNRAQDVELPRRLDFVYRSLGFDYQPGIQSAMRNVGYSAALKTMAIPIVLDDTTARQVADICLTEAWNRRMGYVIRLPSRWYQVAPGDVLSVPGIAGENRLMKVTQITAGLPGQIVASCVAYDPDAYSQTSLGAALASGGVQTLVYAGSIFVMEDLPALRPQDSQTPGFYAGACSDGTGIWQGATLYSDTGSGYGPIAHFDEQATIGAATTGLPSGPTSGFDTSSTVTIQLNYGSLSSCSQGAITNDPTRNACMIGGEILQFASAVLQTPASSNIWILSDLKRGVKGTSVSGHVSGDKFMLLNGAVKRIPLATSQVGTTFPYKTVTDGQDPTTVTTSQSIVTTENSYTPYALQSSIPANDTAGNGISIAGGVISAVVDPAGKLSLSGAGIAAGPDLARLDAAQTWTGAQIFNPYVEAGVTGAEMCLGQNPSYPGYAAVWMAGYDYSLLTDGNNTYLNAPGASGYLVFRKQNVTVGGLSAAGALALNGLATAAYTLDCNTGSLGFGILNSRTEVKQDAGLFTANQSGFFQADSANTGFADWPTGATGKWHLIDCRYGASGNYALQIAGSFADQNAYVRKINNNAGTAWNRLLTSLDVGADGYHMRALSGGLVQSLIWDNGTEVGFKAESGLVTEFNFNGHFASIGNGGTTGGGTSTANPTAVVGAAAGTGGTPGVGVAFGGTNYTDVAGQISVTTGATGMAAGTLATITFASAYTYAPKSILLTPANQATAAVGAMAAVPAAASWQLVTPVALAANTTYTWCYWVMQ